MASKIVTREEMLQRVARFKELTPSSRPLVDAVLPQFNREIFNVIGGGVTEDASMKVPITAVEGFHLSIIKAGPKKARGCTTTGPSRCSCRSPGRGPCSGATKARTSSHSGNGT